MPSITTWTRLEPICREDDVRAGLEARVHDPLWMLGRQWQMSELRALPEPFHLGLARLYMQAERDGRWPDAMKQVPVALVAQGRREARGTVATDRARPGALPPVHPDPRRDP